MKYENKIYITGHEGLVGSALLRLLKKLGYTNILTKSSIELDLRNQNQVQLFFEKNRPSYVILAAGKVGGVYANNTYRAEFIYDNLMIQTNVIHQSYLSEVKKLIFLGCSSMYPQVTPQPIKEEYLLSGYLEPTNEPFAIAKLAGLKMCESYNRQYGTDFISLIPTSLYGINQNYEPMNSLVVPALIRKFNEAKQTGLEEVIIWGTGRPSRDFLFVEDLADAIVFLMENYVENETLNIGTGQDYTIQEIVEIIKGVVGYTGNIVYDVSKPDGVLVRLQDVSKITQLGWQPKIKLHQGLQLVCEDYLTRNVK